ncbi:retrovirus-related Pol polyprotein from type-1 retrotransposable element R2 [Trichonephila inaurata madagascariensis]|uniref:Retrovirus-related Pol polyprotein from type-1 retrotransposable element R2 n=1 Tax=Trichonephila inaurata madagascariensis TaxID=2747483 RepID=A0A8X6YSW6_9ARAC|nr:retrovirus-related Pol polyprotein from type-1 retrotransposable element R2 [Trichonephila inaurata madagascariensis]
MKRGFSSWGCDGKELSNGTIFWLPFPNGTHSIAPVQGRISRDPTDGDLTSFLCGSMKGSYTTTSNALSNTWTLARMSSSRQGISWSFSDGVPSITFGGSVLTASYSNKVIRKLHDNLRQTETDMLISQPSQGKGMECVALAPESSHFIQDGLFTRFADWRFIHKAWLNLTELNGAKSWDSEDQKKCRKCDHRDETPPHVLNHCPSYSAAWQMRHNDIVRRLKKAVAFRGTILSENQVVGTYGLHPDLVATVGNTLYIIDVTVPFENRREAFQQASERKVTKYRTLIPFFNSIGYEAVEIVPILIGALGAWDLSNDRFLKIVATRRYLKTLKKLCVSDSIKWSRDICIQHLTGKRLYGNTKETLPVTNESPAFLAQGVIM